MSATEELRRLLDERGVEYDEAAAVISETVATFWCDRDGEPCTALEGADDIPDGKLSVQALLTPVQAIDATLGRGTCRPVDGYDDDGEEIGEVCSECGEPWPYFNARYCPNCGAKVVDDAQDDG